MDKMSLFPGPYQEYVWILLAASDWKKSTGSTMGWTGTTEVSFCQCYKTSTFPFPGSELNPSLVMLFTLNELPTHPKKR